LDIGFKERKVWNVFNFKSLYIKYQFTCVYWKAVSLRCKQITFIICYNLSAISRIDTYRFFPVKIYMYMYLWLPVRDSRGRDRMVVGFTTTSTCVISDYHNYRCELESWSWRGVLDTTLCDTVCQGLVTGLWFSPGLRFPPPIKPTGTIWLKYCSKWV
jgi:hypothetical protein